MINPQTSHQPPRFVILFIRDQLTVGNSCHLPC